MLSIGCPEEYSVIITARDCATYAGSIENWSQFSWSRTLDDISECSITVPDVLGGLRCNIEMGDSLVPWRYGIRIERNGALVWCGPITTITRPTREGGAGADYVTITALDKLAWTQKRTQTTDLIFSNQDAGTVFKSVLDDAMFFDNLPGLYCPTFATGYSMTREVLALNFEYAYDTLQDLAHSAVDYFMFGDKLAVQDQSSDGFPRGWYVIDDDGLQVPLAPTPDPYGRYLFGTFTDEAWISRPGWNIDGMGQGNDIFVPGTDSGEAGFRRYWTASDVSLLDGLLTYVDVNSLYRPQADTVITADGVFQERADSLLALRRNAPIVISGGSLGEAAPISLDYMFPGSIWAIDLAEHGLSQLLTVQRLKRVDVSVSKSESGLVETVSPTLIPLGTDEADGG